MLAMLFLSLSEQARRAPPRYTEVRVDIVRTVTVSDDADVGAAGVEVVDGVKLRWRTTFVDGRTFASSVVSLGSGRFIVKRISTILTNRQAADASVSGIGRTGRSWWRVAIDCLGAATRELVGKVRVVDSCVSCASWKLMEGL